MHVAEKLIFLLVNVIQPPPPPIPSFSFSGASDPDAAARVVRDGISLDFLYGLFAGLMLFTLLRPYWGAIFTNDNDVKLLGIHS